MARLRLGMTGLLLLVLAAIGFELGGVHAAGIDPVLSEIRETQFDPVRGHGETATASVAASADDSDDDPHLAPGVADAATAPGIVRPFTTHPAAIRPDLRPRATGPPALSIV